MEDPFLKKASSSINSCLTTLHGIWDEIGFSKADVDSMEKELLDKIMEYSNNMIDDAKTQREEIKQEVDDQLLQLNKQRRALSMPAVELQSFNEPSLMEKQDKIQRRVQEISNEYHNRCRTFRNLQKKLRQLLEEIGETSYSLDLHTVSDMLADEDGLLSDLSEERQRSLDAAIQQVEKEKDNRAAAVTQCCDEITALWKELQMAPSSEFEEKISTREGIGFTNDVIEKLSRMALQLSEEKKKRETRIAEMGQEITRLWGRLGTSVEDQTAWLDAHEGLGRDVLDACEDKLRQLQADMKSRLKELIQEARREIMDLWEATFYPKEDRNRFTGFLTSDDMFSETVLEQHETYIEQLKREKEALGLIMRLLEKRATYLAEREEYEAILADPTRLTSRKGGAQRLHEENLERDVTKRLPQVTAKLKRHIQEFEAEHQRSLETTATSTAGATAQVSQRYDGAPDARWSGKYQPLLDIVEQEDEAIAAEKRALKEAREAEKQARLDSLRSTKEDRHSFMSPPRPTRAAHTPGPARRTASMYSPASRTAGPRTRVRGRTNTSTSKDPNHSTNASRQTTSFPSKKRTGQDVAPPPVPVRHSATRQLHNRRAPPTRLRRQENEAASTTKSAKKYGQKPPSEPCSPSTDNTGFAERSCKAVDI